MFRHLQELLLPLLVVVMMVGRVGLVVVVLLVVSVAVRRRVPQVQLLPASSPSKPPRVMILLHRARQLGVAWTLLLMLVLLLVPTAPPQLA